MNLEYKQAQAEDIERLYELNKTLIDRYEDIQSIEYDKVLKWVRRKIESCIAEYTCVYVNNEKAGYYHFFKNDDGLFELDDLYIFSDYQRMGIGTEIINKCCMEANSPVYLYVFIKNQGAVALYERLGFKIVQTIEDSRYLMQKRCNSLCYLKTESFEV